MPHPIAFLSDFGLTDEFVGVVHAVLARISPESRVLDITHQVPRGDVRAGALTLVRAIQYLPGGVVLAVVDPGVGTGRRAIAASTEWGYLVGPDNGLLAPATQMVGGADRIVSIENTEYRLPGAAATFDGRDVFAPAAALLAAGEIELGDLGPTISTESAMPLILPLVDHTDEGLRGEVLWVDTYGNCQTNITPEDMATAGLSPGNPVELSIGATTYSLEWVTAYGDVEPGEGLVHVDSYGQVAVAVREGRADEDFNLTEGRAVVLKSPQ